MSFNRPLRTYWNRGIDKDVVRVVDSRNVLPPVVRERKEIIRSLPVMQPVTRSRIAIDLAMPRVRFIGPINRRHDVINDQPLAAGGPSVSDLVVFSHGSRANTGASVNSPSTLFSDDLVGRDMATTFANASTPPSYGNVRMPMFIPPETGVRRGIMDDDSVVLHRGSKLRVGPSSSVYRDVDILRANAAAVRAAMAEFYTPEKTRLRDRTAQSLLGARRRHLQRDQNAIEDSTSYKYSRSSEGGIKTIISNKDRDRGYSVLNPNGSIGPFDEPNGPMDPYFIEDLD